jgi:SAM-dependent methyltransferase
MWAAVTNPSKRGRRWNRDEFFATGEAEIEGALALLSANGVDPPRGRALDFGCGVGRLTRALASRFDTAAGVDVAASMIEQARALNGDVRNATFVHNPHDDLAVIPSKSVDFLYSRLVLQHIPPPLSERYVAEFVRVLSPAGVAMFQVPRKGSGRTLVRRVARRLRSLALLRRLFRGRMSMYVLDPKAVRAAVARGGGRVERELDDPTASEFPSTMYIVQSLARC